jgi:hypothetical protein
MPQKLKKGPAQPEDEVAIVKSTLFFLATGF